MIELAALLLSICISASALVLSIAFFRWTNERELLATLHLTLQEIMELGSERSTRQADIDRTLSLATRCDWILRKNKSVDLCALDLATIGSAFHEAWEPNLATQYLRQASAKAAPSSAEIVRVCELRAQQMFASGNADEGRSLMEEALRNCGTDGDRSNDLKIQVMRRWCDSESKFGATDFVEELSERGHSIAKTLSARFRRERAMKIFPANHLRSAENFGS